VTTAARIRRPSDLPPDAVHVRPDGLLHRVARRCPEHGVESPCVARCADRECLVFWCPEGDHHFTAR